jgi:phosphoribosylcarboxyaminoimidazole (NCAIR) mutase
MGARTAGYLAVSILALADARLARRLVAHKKTMADEVAAKSKKLPASLERILSSK